MWGQRPTIPSTSAQESPQLPPGADQTLMLLPQLSREGPEQTHRSAHRQGRPAYAQTCACTQVHVYTQTRMKTNASVRRKRTPEGNLGIKEGLKSGRYGD